MNAPTLPRSLAPFLALPVALRQEGFPASPEQTQDFLAGVGLLGPRSLGDIRRAAHALFGPAPERRDEFDAVFDSVFLGRAFAAPAEGTPEDMPNAYDAAGLEQLPDADEEEPSGADAARAERLTQRTLDALGDEHALRRFGRDAPNALPRRRSRRMRGGHGRMVDPRVAFRQMLRRDGEVIDLPRRHRRQRQRRVLLLIDVSGSMKEGTEGALQFAHTLVQAGERVETFTLGTRLTRVTRALRHRSRDQALMLAAGLVADWDGGTRLGEALAVFLSVPRFASFARGALVVVISDGLERGGPDALVSAMERLRGLAWRVLWLSPLAGAADYRAQTAAMEAIAPQIDRLGDGSSAAAYAREVLAFAHGAGR